MPDQNEQPLVFIASVLMARNAVAQDADECEPLHNTCLARGSYGILGLAYAGKDWVNAMRPGLEHGYATATFDSGHHALSVMDAAWACANPHAERDWGWRSIGETHRIAQVLIDAFYNSDAE